MRILLFLLFASTTLVGQTNDQDPKYTVAQLREDFTFFRIKMETKHPNFYLYTSKEVLDKKLDELYSSITKPMTGTEFYRHIASIQQYIKDGHNYLLPGKDQLNFYANNARYFPLDFVLFDSKLFVTKNLSRDSSIMIGDEICTINGENALAIFNRMVEYQVRDGINLQYPKYITQTFFRSYYGFFFGFKDFYEAELKNLSGVKRVVKIEGVPFKEIKNKRDSSPPLRYDRTQFSKGVFWEFNPGKNYTLLTIKTWNNDLLKSDYRQHFKKEIKTFLLELKKNNPGNLIIDLRGNQGGDGKNGILLLKHLLPHSFRYFYSVKKLNSHHKLKNTSRNLTKEHKPSDYIFQGQVYVLTNGGSFSNSGIFSSLIKIHKRGKIIGEETGGNGVILTGGDNNYEFPNTKINLFKATDQMIVSNQIKNTGEGVKPDIEIKPDLNSILNNEDLVLKKAIELCKK